jgi:hypothetical protein
VWDPLFVVGIGVGENRSIFGKGNEKGWVTGDGIYVGVFVSWANYEIDIELLHFHDPLSLHSRSGSRVVKVFDGRMISVEGERSA